MMSAVQAAPISFMHSLRGQSAGGGGTRDFLRFTIPTPYRMVTRFCGADPETPGRNSLAAIHVAMNGNDKQTALITGASSGIGLALAQAFRSEGFNVAANSRNISSAGTLTASDSLLLIDGDIAVPSTAERLVNEAEQRFGRIHLLVNNAGIFVPRAFEAYTPEEFQRVIATNLGGFFFVSQAAVRHMRRSGGGHILNITTTLAQQPVAGVNAALTSLTKGGLNAVTRALAIEYAAHGIRVNAIAPGIIDTPMHQPEQHDALKRLHPIQRLGSVQEIVDAALFLNRAPFITGEVLHVDGGAHAGKW